MQPEVAARRPWHLSAGASNYQHLLDARDFLQRLIGVGLERNLAPAAQAFIGGDNQLRFAVLDAAGERVRREAAEHHGMDRSDAGAGEHGVSRFGDPREVVRDSVAALDPLRLQHIGDAADFLMELAIGNVARFCRRIVRLPDDGDLFAALLEMPVDAVGRHVKGAVLEPFDRHVWIVERGVLDDGVGLDPVDALALFAPELVGPLDAFLVELLVFAFVDKGAVLPFLGDLVGLEFEDLMLSHRIAPPYARASVSRYFLWQIV